MRPPPVPLLWKVSKGDARVYLLGSFHLLKQDDYPLSPDVDRAFADARRLVFELAPEEVESPDLGRRMVQAALRQDGSSLQQELDAQTWRKLQAYAASRRLSLDTLTGYRPWFVGLTVSLAGMAQQGMDPVLGLDRHFMQLAAKSGKPATGLERADEQIALLAGMSPEEQRQMLAESLDDAAGGEGQTGRLHEAWRRGDAERLWKEMAQDMRRQYPALYRSINVERNERWVPRLEQMLRSAPADGNVLVVVGALHLLGGDGVVEKLRARGYRVERVCSACAGGQSAETRR
ncbi:MAG: TraB/GumN family protein [Pseudomonas sp.]